ncbi:MAG: helix-turn-helix transcriptional regulator [Cyanobacteriota bacterium]|nr:helix-turn-helix transcriptional regulator [Cyanobacteriota bacterium]
MKNGNNDELTLDALLQSAGLSQEQLAVKIGLTRSTIYNWKSGKKVPRLDHLLLMAKELNVSLKTLSKVLGYDVSGVPDDPHT